MLLLVVEEGGTGGHHTPLSPRPRFATRDAERTRAGRSWSLGDTDDARDNGALAFGLGLAFELLVVHLDHTGSGASELRDGPGSGAVLVHGGSDSTERNVLVGTEVETAVGGDVEDQLLLDDHLVAVEFLLDVVVIDDEGAV